jgi:flagellar hook-associated protein 1 FlgK
METQLLNTTGVNLDEEMALLIQIQTAYTASTKTIDAVNKMFDDLLAAIR